MKNNILLVTLIISIIFGVWLIMIFGIFKDPNKTFDELELSLSEKKGNISIINNELRKTSKTSFIRVLPNTNEVFFYNCPQGLSNKELLKICKDSCNYIIDNFERLGIGIAFIDKSGNIYFKVHHSPFYNKELYIIQRFNMKSSILNNIRLHKKITDQIWLGTKDL